jgi:hypothetical protein
MAEGLHKVTDKNRERGKSTERELRKARCKGRFGGTRMGEEEGETARQPENARQQDEGEEKARQHLPPPLPPEIGQITLDHEALQRAMKRVIAPGSPPAAAPSSPPEKGHGEGSPAAAPSDASPRPVFKFGCSPAPAALPASARVFRFGSPGSVNSEAELDGPRATDEKPEEDEVDVQGGLARGRDLISAGETEAALGVYRRLVAACASDEQRYWRAVCWNQIGLCQGKLGCDAEAVQAYTEAIESGEENELHIWLQNRGKKLKQLGEVKRAEADFQRVIELRSDSKQAEKARSYLQQLARQSETEKAPTPETVPPSSVRETERERAPTPETAPPSSVRETERKTETETAKSPSAKEQSASKAANPKPVKAKPTTPATQWAGPHSGKHKAVTTKDKALLQDAIVSALSERSRPARTCACTRCGSSRTARPQQKNRGSRRADSRSDEAEVSESRAFLTSALVHMINEVMDTCPVTRARGIEELGSLPQGMLPDVINRVAMELSCFDDLVTVLIESVAETPSSLGVLESISEGTCGSATAAIVELGGLEAAVSCISSAKTSRDRESAALFCGNLYVDLEEAPDGHLDEFADSLATLATEFSGVALTDAERALLHSAVWAARQVRLTSTFSFATHFLI